MGKRVLLFLATNLAVLVLIGIVTTVFGVGNYLGPNGIDMAQLLIFAAIVGFSGSLISLALSKPMAKWSVGARVIDGTEGGDAAFLVGAVRRQAEALGLRMPEVAVFDDPSMNAFATGATRNSALVAVSTGLLRGMDRKQVEAVLAHEMAHVANGDMVTMALLQGVLNTFVIAISRVIAYAVDTALRSNDEEGSSGHSWVFMGVSLALDLVLGIFASMIAAWFSRQREFRADAGGAKLAGSEAMASALERLKAGHEAELPGGLRAFGIRGGMMSVFASHPPLEERIARLRQGS